MRAGFGIFYSPTNATSVGRQSGLFSSRILFRTEHFRRSRRAGFPALILDNGIPGIYRNAARYRPSLANGGRDRIHESWGRETWLHEQLDLQRAARIAGPVPTGSWIRWTAGTALPSGLENLNQVDFKYLSLGNTLNADINSAAAQAAGVFLPIRGSQVRSRRHCDLILSIPTFGICISRSAGAPTMQCKCACRRRFSAGISFLAAYTLSKSIVSGGGYTGLGDDAAGARPLDTNNRLIEKRLAGFDTPQNLVLSWGYELPFGKGKTLLRQRRRCREPTGRRLADERHPSLCFGHSDRRIWRWCHSVIEWGKPAKSCAGRVGAHRRLAR